MLPKMFSSLFLLFVCTLGVNCDNIEDAKGRGIVTVYTLRRTKMDPIPITKDGSTAASLEIFCYEGVNSVLVERMKRVFSTGKLYINSTGEDYQLFTGTNESSVFDAYSTARQTWLTWRKLFPWQSQSVPIPPFNQTCIGVSASQKYSVIFFRQWIDPWLLLAFFCGILLFFCADKLSKNVMFYYGTGISVGLLASLLIVVLLMSRFVPWRKGAVAFFLGGWAVAGWACVQVYTNLTDLLQNHYHYVLGYLITAGMLSFAVLYYRGPVKDPRSLNLIKWTVQLVGVVAVFMSMQVEEVAAAVILVLISVYNFPCSVVAYWGRAFRRRFPRQRRLLTQDEYQNQADENTRQALEELRQFCQSPNCDAWKTISRLGTPQRFAKWVEGNSHLSDDEMDLYDSDPHPSHLPEVTDDEDEIDFRLNSL